jgi:hypothetical protein
MIALWNQENSAALGESDQNIRSPPEYCAGGVRLNRIDKWKRQ